VDFIQPGKFLLRFAADKERLPGLIKTFEPSWASVRGFYE
jgi:hypothetical protein